jgi:hypothetical protein
LARCVRCVERRAWPDRALPCALLGRRGRCGHRHATGQRHERQCDADPEPPGRRRHGGSFVTWRGADCRVAVQGLAWIALIRATGWRQPGAVRPAERPRIGAKR